MGVINHNAVIATTWNEEQLTLFREWLSGRHPDEQRLFAETEATINGYFSVVLTPDGSKEGWTESERGDDLRSDFIDWIKTHDYDDGSNPWYWIEVGFGEYGQAVLRGNCVNCYNDRPYAGM